MEVARSSLRRRVGSGLTLVGGILSGKLFLLAYVVSGASSHTPRRSNELDAL